MRLSEWKKIRKGKRNYSGANLICADLSGKNLRGVDLRDANLGGANLSDTNLRFTNLRFTVLTGANLDGANLSCADLRYSDLEHYYISGGSRNDSAVFVPSLKKIWVGCFCGSALQFYRACKSKNTAEHRLYIATLKNILHYLSRKRITK